MTQKEILEFNKLCAEFLGWEFNQSDDFYFTPFSVRVIDSYESIDGNDIFDNELPVKLMLFHSDWNWIMEVMKKVLDVCLNSDSMEMYYNITDAIPEQHQTIQSINQFLIWYNENR